MVRFIRIKSLDKIYYINIDKIVYICPIVSNDIKKREYSIHLINGAFLGNCVLDDDTLTELHIG